MDRKITSNAAFSGSYNEFPDHWNLITEKEYFEHYFMMYVIDGITSRQIMIDRDGTRGALFSARLFKVNDPWDHSELGYGVYWDWKINEPRYFRIGSSENWNRFSGKFAGQFAGDNS